ncbi:hypothetical protein PUN28_018622 [Cardiocondyla obscurior]|uniref:Uncharacterized protein n=1 Tax=Cardiocondyla obscurior TaxID=286306 RepID=A0AAW2EER4_9HYME
MSWRPIMRSIIRRYSYSSGAAQVIFIVGGIAKLLLDSDVYFSRRIRPLVIKIAISFFFFFFFFFFSFSLGTFVDHYYCSRTYVTYTL